MVMTEAFLMEKEVKMNPFIPWSKSLLFCIVALAIIGLILLMGECGG